jgi:Ca-activated chloride channel family protein
MIEVKLLEGPAEAAKRALGAIEIASGPARLQLPLKSVDLTSSVVDRLAHVTVKQTFTNPHDEHLEAVYIFPLSGGCAVSSFEMRVADRIIKGEVQERAAARAQYDTALQEGKRAALLEQERDDVFTVQVGNLPPHEEVTVSVTYSEKLPYFEDGMTELRLPLVVAPRFIAGNPLDRESVGDGTALDTDVVPDASRISPPQLVPGVNAKVDLKIKVILSGDKALEDLCCSQHVTRMGASSDGVIISLAREDELLDRDFVLRWRVATDSVQSKFLIYRNPETTSDCFGMLSIVPPKCTEIAFAPRDVIFVLDRSGSMDGLKMVSAARACSYLLSTLSPHDRFAIQAFDVTFEWMPATGSRDEFVDADEVGTQNGITYLRTINARGGTDIDGALKAAITVMNKRHETKGRQPVVVLLTDGQVGNESSVMANLQRQLGDLRIFTVGVDTAVHAGFLQRLAAVGGGTASFVQPGTELEGALSQVSREIGTPLIENLTIEDINCGLELNTLAPATIPDLFEGRAVTTFFRLHGDKLEDIASGKILVKGKYTDGTIFQQELSAQQTNVEALAQLWAKERVVELEDKFRVTQSVSDKNQLRKEIIETAIQHALLTKFTAFVVVDESEIVNAGGARRKLVQPVQTPALWNEQAPSMPMSPPPQSNLPKPAASLYHPYASLLESASESGAHWKAFAPPDASLQARRPAPGPGSAPPQNSQPSRFEDIGGAANWGSSPTPGAGGGFGSYGHGVQSQVFEVIVQQGVAGMDWRQTCVQIMQINNIDPDKVQEEVDKRVASQGAAPKPKMPTSTNIPEVKRCLERLQNVLNTCFQKLQAGETPEVEELEKARLELISALAQSSAAGSVPQLQKFLRSDLVKLIAAISGANTVNKVLQNLSQQQQKIFQSIQSEISAALEEPTEQPFWQATV